LTEGKDLEVYSIPFSRQELEAKPQADFIHERLNAYLHGNDLFSVQFTIQYYTFFFGRGSLVADITGQIERGQNFGLFGLRKIGKTSVFLAVERYLDKLGNYQAIHIDCQSPSRYLRRWDALLATICEELTDQEIKFMNAPQIVREFENIVKNSSKRVVLLFDRKYFFQVITRRTVE